MTRFIRFAIVCLGVTAFAVSDSLGEAQSPATPSGAQAQAKAVRPHQPGGILSDSLGVYTTIEGVLYDGKGKVESNTLMVDTVDGKKFDKPIGVLIHNARRLPTRTRCVLKGYELGEMIGTPPAIRDAAIEKGQEYVERSAAEWRWRPYFIVLEAVEPKELELIER